MSKKEVTLPTASLITTMLVGNGGAVFLIDLYCDLAEFGYSCEDANESLKIMADNGLIHIVSNGNEFETLIESALFYSDLLN